MASLPILMDQLLAMVLLGQQNGAWNLQQAQQIMDSYEYLDTRRSNEKILQSETREYVKHVDSLMNAVNLIQLKGLFKSFDDVKTVLRMVEGLREYVKNAEQDAQ